MRRKTLYITEQQNRELKELVTETGVSRSELIRRALDLYLEKASLPKHEPGRKDPPWQP